MSHYSDNPADVRIDVWKQSGKWSDCYRLRWSLYDADLPLHTILESLLDEQYPFWRSRWRGMTITCLEPHHKNSHPIMLRAPR